MQSSIYHIDSTGFFYHYDVEIELIRELKPTKISKQTPAKNPTSPPNGGPSSSDNQRPINKDLKRKIWKLFLQASQCDGDLLYRIIPAFDGEKNMYTMVKLKLVNGEISSKDFIIPADDQGSEQKARITIKPCNPCAHDWKQLADTINGKSQSLPMEYFQCIQTVLREAALSNINRVAVRRSYYWRERPVDLGGGAECWPGFYAVCFAKCINERLICAIFEPNFFNNSLRTLGHKITSIGCIQHI